MVDARMCMHGANAVPNVENHWLFSLAKNTNLSMYNLYQAKSEGAKCLESLLKTLVNRNQDDIDNGHTPLATFSY